MNIDYDGDLARAIEGAGEEITVAGLSGYGIVDIVGETILPDGGAPVTSSRWHVAVQAGAFPGLKEGVAVTARGRNWTAYQCQPTGDGREVEFFLLEA